MLYVQVIDCQQPLLAVPESLVMRFPAHDIGVCMEVNGARIPLSEEVSLVLRCSRHSSSGEAPETVLDYMYVSTDNLRTSSTLEFEVLEQAESVVVSGSLEKKVVEPNSRPRAQWAMVSSCEVGPDGCAFVKAKHKLLRVCLFYDLYVFSDVVCSNSDRVAFLGPRGLLRWTCVETVEVWWSLYQSFALVSRRLLFVFQPNSIILECRQFRAYSRMVFCSLSIGLCRLSLVWS
jgi:hypothetical protein